MQSRSWIITVVLASFLVFVGAAWAVAASIGKADSAGTGIEVEIEEADQTDPTVRDGTYSMTEVYVIIGLASAAAVTISVSVLGAGFAVGRIGSSALGAAAEHPELLARSLLFVALAEGLAVLGFAVAMLIVMRMPG
jgi:V/A-type H+-transporting ATPase subunit K